MSDKNILNVVLIIPIIFTLTILILFGIEYSIPIKMWVAITAVIVQVFSLGAWSEKQKKL